MCLICFYLFIRAEFSYELQLKEELRGKGMARRLMDEMERIGRERGMSKCMLTCLTGKSHQPQLADC